MTDHLKQLGERVEAARLNRGWSKEGAARLGGISSQTWKRVEDGLGVQDHKRQAVLDLLALDHEGRVLVAAETKNSGAQLSGEGTLTTRGSISRSTPVGAGVDPDLIAALAEASPDAIEAVRAVLKAIKAP